MSLAITEENLRKAYCAVLAKAGIGAAVKNCKEMMSKKVKVVVPESMHRDFPGRLLASAKFVCTKDPYFWGPREKEPTILDDTTFEGLFKDWFIRII